MAKGIERPNDVCHQKGSWTNKGVNVEAIGINHAKVMAWDRYTEEFPNSGIAKLYSFQGPNAVLCSVEGKWYAFCRTKDRQKFEAHKKLFGAFETEKEAREYIAETNKYITQKNRERKEPKEN